MFVLNCSLSQTFFSAQRMQVQQASVRVVPISLAPTVNGVPKTTPLEVTVMKVSFVIINIQCHFYIDGHRQ